MKKWYWIVAATLIFVAQPIRAETTHLVLSQIQVAGSVANDEWVELYNPTLSPIDLSSFSIQYKSATGSTFQKKNFSSGATIAAHGYYLISNTDAAVASTADMAHSSFSMAGSGGNIFLVNSTTLLTSPTDASIVDRIGYGTGNAPEASAAPAPTSGQSLQRLPANAGGNGTDTDNNAADFVVTSSPAARNSQSPIQPAIATQSSPPSSTTTTDTSTNTSSSDTSSASSSASSATTATEQTPPQSSTLSSTTETSASTSTSSDSTESSDTTNSAATASAPDTNTPAAALTPSASSSALRINEIMARPASEGSEWIELHFSSDPFPLSGWTIEDGKGVISTLGVTPTIGWYVVELSGSHLNNEGDTILLKDAAGATIDRMTYGSFDDGNAADNAPTPGQGQTLNRYPDGKDTDMDSVDWYVSTQPTVGGANSVVAPPPASSTSRTRPPSTANDTAIPNVTINEFVSDPADGETEWIELVNKDPLAVSINGWTIEDGSGSVTPLSGAIGASDADRHYLAANPNGSLNNSGDLILLKNQNRQTVDEVRYGDWGKTDATNAPVARDPWSVARVVDGYRSGSLKKDFAITTKPTPRARNVIAAPETNIAAPSPAPSTASPSSASQKQSTAPMLLINEVFPNPVGADRGYEWIELANRSSTPAEYPRLIIEVRSGARNGIAPFRLAGGATVALNDSIPALPNAGAAVRLLIEEKDSKGRISEKELDRVAYPAPTAEGQSYAMSSEGRWQWTTTPTPAATNAIAQPNRQPVAQFWINPTALEGELLLFDASDSYDPDGQPLTSYWSFSDGTTLEGMAVEKVMPAHKRLTATLTVSDGIATDSTHDAVALSVPGESPTDSDTKKPATPQSVAKKEPAQAIALIELDNLDRNTPVITHGVVSAAPQTFGGIAFALAGSGTLVKLSGYRKWPVLAVGDRVQIRGKVSITQTGTAIRVSDPGDISIQSHGDAPVAIPLAISDVIDRETNDLVTITATIRAVRAKSWLVEDEESEITVIPTTGLPRIPQPQEQVHITGIIEHTATSNRIRARTPDDIAFLSAPPPTSSTRIPLQKTSKLPTVAFASILAGGLLLLIIREPKTTAAAWQKVQQEPEPVVAANGLLQLPTSFGSNEASRGQVTSA